MSHGGNCRSYLWRLCQLPRTSSQTARIASRFSLGCKLKFFTVMFVVCAVNHGVFSPCLQTVQRPSLSWLYRFTK